MATDLMVKPPAKDTPAELAGRLRLVSGSDDEGCPGCGATLGELEREHLGECLVCWDPRKRPPSAELLDALFHDDQEDEAFDPPSPEDDAPTA
ncbi:MAG: hypothetical protein F4Z31_02415 [Gemmatimonadetes bacterium]|nr:hypothetical protein [Gemmatimonadota bacterium]